MRSKIILKLALLIYLCAFTKSFSQENTITMDTNMNLKVNIDNIDQLSESYTIDISDLYFKSENNLVRFCNSMSVDFYTLSGNYISKQITIKLDKQSLMERQFTIERMNSFFANISGRLRSIYHKINQ